MRTNIPSAKAQAQVFLDTLLKSVLIGFCAWLSERGYFIVDVRNSLVVNSEWLETMMDEYLDND